MLSLKARVEQLSTLSNVKFSCRKRKAGIMSDNSVSSISPIIAKRTKKEVAQSSSPSTAAGIKSWLIAPVKTSTPVRGQDDKQVASDSPDPVIGDDDAGRVSSVGLDEDGSVSKPQYANPPSVKSNDGFDSTDSWFLTNVNSYCASLMDATAPDSAPGNGVVSFESTTSSFMMNVNEFCGLSRPKLVDYSSSVDSQRQILRLSLVNDPSKELPVRNEHYASALVHTVGTSDPKGEVLTLENTRGIEFLPDYARTRGYSFLSHYVSSYSSLNQQRCSMVSHMTYVNTVVAQNAMEDAEALELYKTNLWQHLVQVKRCSFKNAFTTAAKRKLDAEQHVSLCESMDGLVLARNKMANLNLSFKKLRLGNATDVNVMSSDDNDGSSDDTSDGCDYNAVTGAHTNHVVVLDRIDPCDVNIGFDVLKQQEIKTSSDVLLSRGKYEAMTSGTQCTPEPKRC